ncbi:hypothetical protein PFISCL1PPCAC_8645 [Pristionchus fissidentatus]|uniref:Uncharacterized protein n=1 Tax=Pristionchus fissidentatus TaxID=1538716 RepID=A0AAV5VGK6_9BILA|nr:hypothetical protein PFISCL1PPCAC_8645 [Pristionchus fissidentatus]
MHQPEDYENSFDPDAYFEQYFGKNSIEDGTRVSLFCLPVFAQIIKQSVPKEKRSSLLDIGAGPTVYSAVCFRDVIERAYMTDFVEKNLVSLKDWTNGISAHDWQPTINVILRTEGITGSSENMNEKAEKRTQELVHAGGVLFSNVHRSPCVPDLKEQVVDIMVSVFCLESACKDLDEYGKCVKNMMSHLRPGGKFIIGSVIDDNVYNAGNQRMFWLLRLTESDVISALEAAGLDVENRKAYVLEDEGVMFAMLTKL